MNKIIFGALFVATLFCSTAAVSQLSTKETKDSQTASRYYLQKRTSSFYKRATCKAPSYFKSDIQVASRYYLKNRTRNFYHRSYKPGRRFIG